MTMLTLLWFIGISVLLIFLGLPLAQRRVPQNPLYGLRVPATLADEWVWYEANAHSGRELVLLGVAQTVVALSLAFLVGLPFPSDAVANGAFLLIIVSTLAVLGWRRANGLLHRRRAQA